MRLSVCGVARRGSSYLIVQRGPEGSQANKWEFPGGKADGDEPAVAALRREWDEELGVDVEVGSFLVTTSFSHAGRDYQLQAWEVNFEGPVLELREHRQAAWVTVDEILAYDLSDSDRTVAEFLVSRG